MLQEKKEALAKKARRDIGTLLEKGKVETAKLRVESMINEDIHVELLELLELYCELLIARFGILDNRCVHHFLIGHQFVEALSFTLAPVNQIPRFPR